MVIAGGICDTMRAAVMSRAMVRDMSLPPAIPDQTAVEVDSLDFCYGSKQSLFNVNILIPKTVSRRLSGRPAAEIHTVALHQPDE